MLMATLICLISYSQQLITQLANGPECPKALMDCQTTRRPVLSQVLTGAID